MNGNNKEKWVKEKLIPNLPRTSTIVSDTASYHSILVEETPYRCVKM
jgi:hypothetical protein